MTSLQGDNFLGSLGGSTFLPGSASDMDIPGTTQSVDISLHTSSKSTPRSGFGSTSELFSSKSQQGKGSKSARTPSPKPVSPRPPKTSPGALSSIPLPVKSSGPIKIPSLLKNARSISKTSSINASRTSVVANKHTLEIQFINKTKRYVQMKKDLLEKQKPVFDLYQNLVQIKKRLAELGKIMQLEEIKLVPVKDYKKSLSLEGAGEEVPMEVVMGMKKSIEEIPSTLLDVCQNLLSRRSLIVDLLENVIKSEVDVSDVADRIETLKHEGQQLQQSLDNIIADHQTKIEELVSKWKALVSSKQSSKKAEELEQKLREQERLTLESNQVINDLRRKLEERKSSTEKNIIELHSTINALREQIKTLEQELQHERKAAGDYKTRNSTNAQSLKNLRSKISELEAYKKNTDTSNSELQRKFKFAQEQLKTKEAMWQKEKDEMSAHIKRLTDKLNNIDVTKADFEIKLHNIEEQKETTEEDLQNTIQSLKNELESTKNVLNEISTQRDEALGKCAAFEGYLARMGLEGKETMDKVSHSIDWGKPQSNQQAENYIEDIAKDLKIRELEDTVRKLEKERVFQIEEKKQLEEQKNTEPTETEKQLSKQQECITKYQMLLEDSENRLREKSTEVANLRSEIRQLKVRQEALEEQNYNCPTEELQKMVEEGRHKLNELMRKSIESEQKLEHYSNVIEKQTQQMSELENLLRYRENMAGVLKASRDELVLEKESLTRYSQEMRTVLAEVTKEGKMKDRLIKELQEKIDLRERQISKLEKEVRELEANLMVTNEKRFKLQETIGSMEKELQSTKAHVNQLADINSRNVRPKFKPF